MFKIRKLLSVISDAVILSGGSDDDGSILESTAKKLWEMVSPDIDAELKNEAIETYNQAPIIEVWNPDSLAFFGATLDRLYKAVNRSIPAPYNSKICIRILAVSMLTAQATKFARIHKVLKEHANETEFWDCPKCLCKNDGTHSKCVNCNELSSPVWVLEELGLLCEEIREIAVEVAS